MPCCDIWIFYALNSPLCIQCIILYALDYMHWIISIMFYEWDSMPCSIFSLVYAYRRYLLYFQICSDNWLAGEKLLKQARVFRFFMFCIFSYLPHHQDLYFTNCLYVKQNVARMHNFVLKLTFLYYIIWFSLVQLPILFNGNLRTGKWKTSRIDKL